MARMMDDSSRARILSQMLSQQAPNQDEGQEYTTQQINTAGGAPGGTEPEWQDPPYKVMNNPMQPMQRSDEPLGHMQHEMPMMMHSPMQKMQGPRTEAEPSIPVPASLAHAGMQALMSQASGGRSLGADGQMASLPIPADIPGEDPTTDDEVEEMEERARRPKRNLNNMRG